MNTNYTNLTNYTNENDILTNYKDGLVYKDLSYEIISAVYEVHNQLGPGFTENIYEEALIKELNARNILHERQKIVKVRYKGDVIGEYKLDLVVENKIILELKAVSELNEVFKSQLLSYLKASKLKLGILINFGSKSIEYVRIVN